jgi:S-layer protein
LGNDTLTISATVDLDLADAVNATVTGIETAVLQSTGNLDADTTEWTGLTSLSAIGADDSTATASATTNVALTVVDGTADVDGGKNVTISSSTRGVQGAAIANDITVGTQTEAVGTVTVTQTARVTNAAAVDTADTGEITVNGGTVVNITSNVITSGAADAAGDDVVIANIVVNNTKGTITSITASQSAATAEAAVGDDLQIINGDVTITDLDTADETDTIAAVTLNYFDDAEIVSNALSTLTLKADADVASDDVTLTLSDSDDAALPTTLNLKLNGGSIGDITGTLADEYTTIAVTTSADTTVADLQVAAAETITVAGAGITTFTATTDIGAVTSITSSGGGLTLGTQLGDEVLFTGGNGEETITLGETTMTISLGKGNDNITINASAFGEDGSVDGGDGTDWITMSAANAATASADNTFEASISNFERLAILQAEVDTEVDLSNLDGINYVNAAGANGAGDDLTISGASSGITVELAEGTWTGGVLVTLDDNGSSDVANVSILDSAEDGANETFAALTLTGFETVNFSTENAEADAVDEAYTITALTAAAAKTIKVTGSAGLNLAAAFDGTALTNFDASAVTLGAITYTTADLAAAATLKGGAGDDAINAAAAVTATVNISGNAGDDTLTGSATKASTIDGGTGNDTITGSSAADSIVGGTGTDTFVADNTEQTGSGAVDGAVINLSSAAISAGDVNEAMGEQSFLAGSQASVAANTATYLFDNESSTNKSVVDTLSGIEIVTGTAGTDYIIGSTAANVINGGAGADVLTGGAGKDTFNLFNYDALDEITDFTDGSSGDNIVLDLSQFQTAEAVIAARTLTLVNFNDAAVAGALTVNEISADETVESGEIFVLTGATFADLAAVETALETGAFEITFAQNLEDEDTFLVVWSDGTDAHVSYMTSVDGAGITANIATTQLVSGNIVTLAGITEIAAGDFVTANFNIQA